MTFFYGQNSQESVYDFLIAQKHYEKKLMKSVITFAENMIYFLTKMISFYVVILTIILKEHINSFKE